MNAGEIWWRQIGTSLRFLSEVTKCLRDCRSAVLQMPRTFPWRRTFYDEIDLRRTAFGGERRLVRISWEEGAEPDRFVMDALCSEAERANYFPGMGRAEYLAMQEEAELNEYDVWVTGIHEKRELVKWLGFVGAYVRTARREASLDRRAVFVLEYDGGETDPDCVERIDYRVRTYDCRVFALEATAALRSSPLPAYQAELALCISKEDPELCAALLRTGEQLMIEPVKTAQRTITGQRSADGSAFREQSEKQLEAAVWRAELGLLFPILERYRMAFIAANEAQLRLHLPISNSDGDRITDPYDLELGSLAYLLSTCAGFSQQDAKMLRRCRKARNLLAHSKPVPYAEAKHVFALEQEEM